ncbi:hypothetical protein E2C01_022427 [Portunus trituberculatus]|uniref:Uncharacterized protein n=1 Tax=Portunus trituberculatus TaxID=210409 RepID=A0A5B7E7N1_PORTR|nr:hypothetical protein [Portunus trituberculatus]
MQNPSNTFKESFPQHWEVAGPSGAELGGCCTGQEQARSGVEIGGEGVGRRRSVVGDGAGTSLVWWRIARCGVGASGDATGKDNHSLRVEKPRVQPCGEAPGNPYIEANVTLASRSEQE